MKKLDRKILSELQSMNDCRPPEEAVKLTEELATLIAHDIQLLEGEFTVEGQIIAREKAIGYCKKSGSDAMVIEHQKVINKLNEI